MKIAVVNTPYATHVGRMAYVLTELARRGHEIELWGSGATRAVAANHGFVYREIPLATNFDAVLQRRLKSHQIFTDLFFSLAKEQLPAVLDLCAKHAPDVIESNARVFAGPLAAQLTGIPVVTHCCSGNSFSQLPQDLYGFCVNGTESERERAVMLKLSREFFRVTDAWFNDQIAKPFGLEPVESAISICSPEHALALSIAELSKPRIAALPNVRMTGPIVVEGDSVVDFQRYRPYCYVSLGTSPWDKTGVLARYRQIVQCTPRELNVVIGLGGLASEAELGIEDARTVIMRDAPQIAAIASSDLVICHGGCQTVHEALYFGKPLVGIPHHAESAEMVNAVEIRGAGVRLSTAHVTPFKLREAIEIATGAPARAAAEHLASRLRISDGRANVLTLFEGLAERSKPH